MDEEVQPSEPDSLASDNRLHPPCDEMQPAHLIGGALRMLPSTRTRRVAPDDQFSSPHNPTHRKASICHHRE